MPHGNPRGGPPPPPQNLTGSRYTPPPGVGTPDKAASPVLLGFAVAAGLGAVLLMLAQGNRGDSAAIGSLSAALGVITFLGLITLAVWKLASPRAGAITLLVLGLLNSCSAIANIGETARADRELVETIEAAQVDAGVDTSQQTFVATAEEDRCFFDQGIDRSDLLSAFTDTSVAGGQTQVRILDALLICAPRVLDDEVWITGNAEAFSAGIGAEISNQEMRCYFQYAIDNSDRPGTALISGDTNFLLAAFDSCFEPETMVIIRGDAGAGPQVYGDDADLDLLYDLCADGNDNACDVLYAGSSFDSEYDILSRDCAGRGTNGSEYCTADMVDVDFDGFADADSPGWVTVLAECRGGDMIACDFAFSAAPLASEIERVGETCGDRVPFLTTTCRDRFGPQAGE